MARYIGTTNLLNSIPPQHITNLLLTTHHTSCAISRRGGKLSVESKNPGTPAFRNYVKEILKVCQLSLAHLLDTSLLELQLKDQLSKVNENFQSTIDDIGVFEKVFGKHLGNNNYSFCFYLIMAVTLRRTVMIEDAACLKGQPISEAEFHSAPYQVKASNKVITNLKNSAVLWCFHKEHTVYINYYSTKLLTLLIASGNQSLILSLLSNPLFTPQDSASLSHAILLAVNSSNHLLLQQLHKILVAIEPSHPSVKVAAAELRRFDLASRTSIPAAEIEKMSGIDFERALQNALTRLSHFKSVERTPQSRDYGADLIITTVQDTRIAVQCKRFATKVNLKAVQEVVAAVKHYGCDLGVVISNNGFLPSAQQLARSNGIELWDGEAVLKIFASEFEFSDIFSI